MKLKKDFYLQEDVVQIARELLGKVLCTNISGKFTSGIITETEAYAGISDRASHAYGGRRTNRTETMFAEGGVAYVYLCYGMHHLFNVVTNRENIPHAVLVRGIELLDGLDVILKRRNKKDLSSKICNGPGTVSQGLGIKTIHSGLSLVADKIWIEDQSIEVPQHRIKKSPRIGVDYAGADAKLLYRFFTEI
ncbi:MAG TPA: DNA-3-methyladenine glycosylase [Bacteroidia bacterium]